MKILGLLLVIALIALGFGYIASRNTNVQSNQSIVATTSQLWDITKNIVGNTHEVNVIFAPGIDPHEYEPSVDDLKVLNNSILVVQNGLSLESKIEKNINESVQNIFTASDYIQTLDSEEGFDPHIWFSVPNVKVIVQNLTTELKRIDPSNSNIYDQNSKNYLAELSDLDTYIRTRVSELPIADRKVVTTHDAFNYFFNEYGLEYVGSIIPNLSTEAEPSAKDLSDLVETIKSENVKAIFLESSINTKLAETLAQETGVKLVESLYGDSLGKDEKVSTYISMMRYNTNILVDNLR